MTAGTPDVRTRLLGLEQIGIKLHIVDVIEEYKDIVMNPKHGYGAHLNPCLDCKGFMVKKGLKDANDVEVTSVMQLTDATMIVSRRSKSAFVAAWRSWSISSLRLESFSM